AIIDSLSVRVDAGELVAIVGPSGCGKTSFLRMIAGLESPTRGQLRLSDGPMDRPKIAYVFQDSTLLPWRTVVENIVLPLELAGKSGRQSYQAAEEALRLVGLRDDDAAKFPRMLSGGMRMRVSLARAVVTHPQVMLFDEPFAALDDLLRSRLNEEILRLWKDQQWTGVFVTHHVSEAIFLSKRVIVLTDRPARIAEVFDIPFEYPRSASLRTTPAFNQIVEKIVAQLRGGER
ncbi:MAG: ABC transporter ATP-binding protein, partial [Pirellulaceae bacterium]